MGEILLALILWMKSGPFNTLASLKKHGVETAAELSALLVNECIPLSGALLIESEAIRLN